MKHTVFIHTNEPQMLGAILAAHALRTRSKTPDAFDVRIVSLSDYPHLLDKEGQVYLRKGRPAVWVNRDLQSFSPLRFLPPQLMGYEGRAILIDPDVFALSDICELFDMDMHGKAVLARTTRSTFGRLEERPFYATSVMLMDCARLIHWRWEEMLDRLFAGAFDYGNWISLRLEAPETVGPLPEEWNHLDTLTPQTRMLHTTERSTQPWKTGLPVDFDMTYAAAKPSRKQPLFKRIRGWLRPEKPQHRSLGKLTHYLPHPDSNQERFIFTLMREALEAGVIEEAYLEECMRKDYLRHDALEVLARLRPFSREELLEAAC